MAWMVPHMGEKLLQAHLEIALAAIEEAHDTHIYSEDNDHPADCQYCAIVREGRAILEVTAADASGSS